MPLVVLVLLIIFGTHRITRLIARDALPLVAVPREKFVFRWGGFSDAKTDAEKRMTMSGKPTNGFMKSLAYLVECDWCVSMWVGAVITAVAWRFTELHDYHGVYSVLIALTASSCAGLIASREPD